MKINFKRVDFFLFYASIFTLSQSIKLSSKLLFLAIIIAVFKSLLGLNFRWFVSQKPLTLLYSIFLLYLIFHGLIIDGTYVFFKSFDKGYASYLVLLGIPFFSVEKDYTRFIPKIFISGLFFTFFLIICLSLYNFEIYDRERILEVFDLHHLYASLYILFSINYILSFRIKRNLKFKFILKVLSLVSLFSFLLLFKSKAAIVISMILIFYHLAIKIHWNFLKAGVFIISIILLTLIYNDFFLEAFIQALDFRTRIWSAAITAIKENYIFGSGSLNEYNSLNIVHFLNGNYDFLDSNFNAHNQYLTFLLKFGFMGAILLLICFFVPTKNMHRKILSEYIGFLIILFLMFCIESLYNRHHGIVFCTVMLYYYNSLDKRLIS